MGDPRTKLDILYQESLGDIAEIITRIEKINSKSENITKVIEKFNALEQMADKKIDDINSVTKLFNKNIYLGLACTFLFTAVIGAVSGYIFFKEELQTKVFESELKKVTDARLKFEAENQSMMFAKQNGVIFYSDSVALPTKRTEDLRLTGGDKPGYIYYPYPNNPYKAPKK